MKIAVIGTGYVGLVTGTCLAETGNVVTCVDINEEKVQMMRDGKVPIYEPGLDILFHRNIEQDRLKFTTDLAEAISDAKIIFLALPTPPGENGAADLSYVLGASKDIAKLITEYKVIITKSTDVSSPSAYKEANDVVRVKVKPVELAFPIETFNIVFDNIKPTSMDAVILWDKTVVPFNITTEIDSKVTAQIDQLMKTDKPPYFQAAMYYLENGKDLDKAVTWMDKAIQDNPKAFWVYHNKANALVKLGKKKEAVEAANKSIELAKEARNEDYVQLNEKLLATLK